MFSPTQLLEHTQTYLPAFTDLFSEVITGATATISGSTVTVSTPSAHSFVPGDKLTLVSGTFLNTITAAVLTPDDTVRFTVGEDHDLTEPQPQNFADPTTLTLQGIGAPWDGVHVIDSVPNRRTFEVALPAGETTAPAPAGALVEDRPAGVTGIQVVATVPDPNTITFDVSDVPALPGSTVEGLKILSAIRIAGAEDITRARQIYARHNPSDAEARPWAFFMMADTTASKDRHSHNDAIAAFTAQDMRKQTLLQNFSTIVMLPTTADKTGFTAMSQAHDEVFRALASTLYAFRPDDPDTAIQYVVASNGHGPAEYDTSVYTHVYDWQVPTVVTYEDGFEGEPDVAFRDILGTFNVNREEAVELVVNVNLDDEPLP